jgi:subtilisin family serine protease
LNWAASNLGSKGVINMSIVSPTYSTIVANAVAAAWTAGHVMVAAAGNTASNSVKYPAAYSNVIGVSGVNQNMSFAGSGSTIAACNGSYSNYGSFVDIAGPFDAYTTAPTNAYTTICGTSFATPHVAAAALIARAAHPSWENTEVSSQLTYYTAQRLNGGGYSSYTGYGVVRADLAAGLYAVSLSAALVSQKPKLTWDAVPLAAQYRIYRRIFRSGVGGAYEHWATTTSTSWADIMLSSSFFGYGTWPASGTAIEYHVTVVTGAGFESSWGMSATFIPIGEPPE